MSTADHESVTAQHIEAVRALREALAELTDGAAEAATDAATAAPQPPYDERIESGLSAVQELTGEDPDYLAHIDEVGENGIATASLAQLGTVVTFLRRGEQHAPGFIGGGIANGKVSAVVDRLIELRPQLQAPQPDEAVVRLAVEIAEDPHGWLERTGEDERPDRDAPVIAVLCRMGAGLVHDLAAALGLTPREVFRQVQVSTLEALAPDPDDTEAATAVSGADGAAGGDTPDGDGSAGPAGQRLRQLALAEQAADDAHRALLAVENGPDSEYYAAALARMGPVQATVTFGVLLHRIAATTAGSTETDLDTVLHSLRAGAHAGFDAGRAPVEPEEDKLRTLHGLAIDLSERALTDSALHKRVATVGDPTALWTMMCSLGVAHVHLIAQDRDVDPEDVWRQLHEGLGADGEADREPHDAATAERVHEVVPIAWAAMRQGPESRPFLNLTLMAPLPAQIVAFGVGLERVLALAGDQFDTGVEEIRHVLRSDGFDELLGRDAEAAAESEAEATGPDAADHAPQDAEQHPATPQAERPADMQAEHEVRELMVDPARVQQVLAELVVSDDEGPALAEAAREAGVPGAFLLLVAERIVAAGVDHLARRAPGQDRDEASVWARLRALLEREAEAANAASAQGQSATGQGVGSPGLTPSVVLSALEAGPASSTFTALYDAPDRALVPALVQAVRTVDDAARD